MPIVPHQTGRSGHAADHKLAQVSGWHSTCMTSGALRCHDCQRIQRKLVPVIRAIIQGLEEACLPAEAHACRYE